MPVPSLTPATVPATTSIAGGQATSDPTDYQLIAESIPHIVWVAGADGATEYFNRQVTDYTGRAAEAMCGFGWIDLVHQHDVWRVCVAWEAATRDGTPFAAEMRIRRHDGEYRWHACRALPTRDEPGRITRWIGTATDIDDLRRAEANVKAAERQTVETAKILETLQSTAPVGFGFVNREYRYLRVNKMLADINGRSIEDHLGRRVAEVVPLLWPQIEPAYRQLLESGKPILGLEMSGETAADPARKHHWLVNLYPVRVEAEIIGIGIIVIDISERKEAEEARRQISHAAVEAMAATVEARDPYTAGHQRRVAEIAVAIAAEMGVSAFDIEGIELAASIHDVGKIRVPAEILARPGRLHPAEFELVKTHCQAGYEIVREIKFPWPVADMIHHHHERFDGAGYPQQLTGAEIVIGARIIAVADVLEAMSAHRPYRPGLGIAAALGEISKGRGSLFDPNVVDALQRIVDREELPLVPALQPIGIAS